MNDHYKALNTQRFFNAMFAFTSEENDCIAREVIRLSRKIQPNYQLHFQKTINELQQQATQHLQSTKQIDEAILLATITKNRQLGEHYIAAFIVSTLTLSSYDPIRFEQYKALSLLCITYLSIKGEHNAKVKAICDEIRLFAQGKREALASFLPDIRQLSLEDLVDAFEKLVNEHNPTPPPPSETNQLKHYYRPYEATINDKQGFTRSLVSTEFNRHGKLVSCPAKHLDDDSDYSSVEIFQIRQASNQRQDTWQKEDQFSDNDCTLNIVKSENTYNGTAAQALTARAVVARIQRKEMAVACDISLLTSFDISCLAHHCVEDITHKTSFHDTALATLMVLLTGLPLSLVKKLKVHRNECQQITGFKHMMKLPSHNQRSELHPLITGVTQKYWLPLPVIITTHLKRFTFPHVNESDIKLYLSMINKNHHCQLTITKVSAYLTQKLLSENVDSVFPAYIQQTDIRECPALFYTQISLEKLHNTYRRYIRFIAKLIGDPVTFSDFTDQQTDNATHSLLLGSPLAVEPALLRSLFSHLHQRLNVAQSDEDSHNLRTLYIQLVLALSSGYRPVTGWFGKLAHFYFPTGDYWISDKESARVDCSRVVKLPQTTLSLLKQHIEYCKTRMIQLSNQNPELSQRYQDSIDSNEHLFFYLSHGKVTECIPSRYTTMIDPIFPLQANWARHHIRSLFSAKGVEPSMIAAWMGHQFQGKRGYHQHSGLSQQDMKQIAQLIQDYLIDLKVRDTL